MLNVHLQLLSFSCMPNNSAAASGRDAAAIVESVEAGEIIEHMFKYVSLSLFTFHGA